MFRHQPLRRLSVALKLSSLTFPEMLPVHRLYSQRILFGSVHPSTKSRRDVTCRTAEQPEEVKEPKKPTEKLAKRPGYGTIGRDARALCNLFEVSWKAQVAYEYRVDITPVVAESLLIQLHSASSRYRH